MTAGGARRYRRERTSIWSCAGTRGDAGGRQADERAAHRSAERLRGIRDVGPRPALLAAAEAFRGGRDPGPPDGVVPRRRRHRPAGDAPLGLGGRVAAATAPTGTDHGRRGVHHGQLGRLHLGREQRTRGRGLARLLHQPARHHRHGRAPAEGTAAAGAVGGGRRLPRRRARPDDRLRPAALDLPLPGLLLRHVRPGEEEGQPGRAGVAGRRDRGPVPARAGVSAVAGRRRARRPSAPTAPGTRPCSRRPAS